MIIVELPWPPKELSPNARLHWAEKRKYTTAYKSSCWAVALGVFGCLPREWPDTVEMTITFFPPDKRRRDDDNIIGSFKAGRDGLAEAMKIDDSRFRPTYKFAHMWREGKVVITI